MQILAEILRSLHSAISSNLRLSQKVRDLAPVRAENTFSSKKNVETNNHLDIISSTYLSTSDVTFLDSGQDFCVRRYTKPQSGFNPRCSRDQARRHLMNISMHPLVSSHLALCLVVHDLETELEMYT